MQDKYYVLLLYPVGFLVVCGNERNIYYVFTKHLPHTNIYYSNTKCINRGRRGRDHMVVGFTTTFAISAYYHKKFEFESRSWRSLLDDTTLCDKACKWLATGRWLTQVSSNNKTVCHDITAILLKGALNTIILTLK